MRSFIFDVDGTLTPSRGKIDQFFAKWFEGFASDNPVYYVTGSDRKKTLEQIGETVYNLADKVYQCSGNDIWKKDKHILTNPFPTDPDLINFLESLLDQSKYETKTGAHIDVRAGLLNFSVVGRNATKRQRSQYFEYDVQAQERQRLADLINSKFGKYEVSVAGETGIDITLRGRGKEQIIHDFSPHSKVYFFGDRMEYGGNDYELAREVAHSGGDVHQVKNWKHTWEILKRL